MVVVTTSTVRTPIGGTVTDVNSGVGQSVKRGDVLVQLDRTTAEVDLAEAAAKREYEAKDVAENEKAAKMAVVSQSEVDLKRAQLALAESELTRAKHALDATRITAPFDGTVASCDVQEGDFVETHQAVATVLQSGPQRVEFNLPQSAVGKVKVGTPVSVEFGDVNSKLTAAGKVIVLSPMMDRGTGTQRVTAQLAAARPELLAGMYVEVSVNPR
jgi:membrane fusion protein (multidrug efflux system)